MIEDTTPEQPQPNLFILTLWQHALQGQDSGDGAGSTLTGRVVHITSGKACTFLSPHALGVIILEMLDAERSPNRYGASGDHQQQGEE